MIKGIIFDFDGVIVDTESKKFKDIQRILDKYGYSIKKNIFPQFVGKKTHFFLNEKFPDIPQNALDKIMKERRSVQYKNIKENRIIAGLRDLLVFLKQKNLKIGIATGSERKFVKKILNANKISKYFDFLITGEDFRSSKPNPEVFLNAIQKTKLSKKEILIVEDSVAGIKAAKAINCKVFAITTYLKKPQLRGADKIFKNHFEILKYLKSKSFY
jgi:HAD superfamily hydrolase (TIGR01509 family)